MSFRVLVIPEDPTNNGYILKPLVERILSECGKPNAEVRVLTDPYVRGYEQAKKLIADRDFLYLHRRFQLVLFLPDADGKDRSGEFAPLETGAQQSGVKLLCCAAEQEVEVWLMAGHVSKLEKDFGTTWSDVRRDVSSKENSFQPFLETYGDTRSPGAGRSKLMSETLNNYKGLVSRCPELKHLQDRIREMIDTQTEA